MNRTSFAKTILPLLLSILVLFTVLIAGCKKTEAPTPTPTKTPTSVPVLMTPTPTLTFTPMPTATPTSTSSEPTATPTATWTPTPAGPTLIEITDEINPLTGLKTDPAKLNRRPLTVKIANYPAEARPQAGLNKADVMFEYETEAYITRFTAIYLGQDAELIGPVRSLRLPDAEVTSIFKAALVASGGHPAVKKRMVEGKAWAEGYKRILCPEEPFLGDGGALRRISGKKPRVELTMYTDTTAMWRVLDERGINGRQNFYDMFAFSEDLPLGGRDANTLTIIYKPGWVEVEYRYDAASKTYKRFDLGQPLIDELDGTQVAPANVVVIYVNHVDTDILADEHDPKNPWYAVSIQLWGTGPAKVFRDGKVYDATWVRENPQKENDRLILRDAQGQQIPFHPGTTWIQLVRLDGNVTIK